MLRRSVVLSSSVPKGYYGTSSRTLRGMMEQSRHSLQYQYRDRRNKKRDIRRLWIQRINAAARINGMSYSTFMHGLKVAGVELDRKVLAQIAYEDPTSFADIAEISKKAWSLQSKTLKDLDKASPGRTGPFIFLYATFFLVIFGPKCAICCQIAGKRCFFVSL